MAHVTTYYINYTTDDNGMVIVYSIEDYSKPYHYWYGYFAGLCVE